MNTDLTDHIEYIVKKRQNNWAVCSLVMTNFGSKPAENFIVENVSKEWCEGFAAAYRALESRRTPEPLDPPFEWNAALRKLRK